MRTCIPDGYSAGAVSYTHLMNARKAKHGGVLTFVFSLISLIYVFPIVLVLINSFKKKAYISRKPFAIPSGKMLSLIHILQWLETVREARWRRL